ncbi:hypothetical protein QQZ08_002623 [Neonectria magnoliae]|uniref:BTB domain-containing protein n=1 Tax=Neonectria magnoliae TaxID=2732573 RepID=A0ABR1ICW2_9HYPO
MPNRPAVTRARSKAITPEATTKGTTLEVDPAGDLYLIVGNDPPQEMLVDSRALCRSSRVFRKMLGSNFSEAKPDGGRWQVKLPEDSPKALALLMNIVHSSYDRVPMKLEIDDLFDMCVLVDKYDMERALWPVASAWIQPYSSSRK